MKLRSIIFEHAISSSRVSLANTLWNLERSAPNRIVSYRLARLARRTWYVRWNSSFLTALSGVYSRAHARVYVLRRAGDFTFRNLTRLLPPRASFAFRIRRFLAVFLVSHPFPFLFDTCVASIQALPLHSLSSPRRAIASGFRVRPSSTPVTVTSWQRHSILLWTTFPRESRSFTSEHTRARYHPRDDMFVGAEFRDEGGRSHCRGQIYDTLACSRSSLLFGEMFSRWI